MIKKRDGELTKSLIIPKECLNKFRRSLINEELNESRSSTENTISECFSIKDIKNGNQEFSKSDLMRKTDKEDRVNQFKVISVDNLIIHQSNSKQYSIDFEIIQNISFSINGQTDQEILLSQQNFELFIKKSNETKKTLAIDKFEFQLNKENKTINNKILSEFKQNFPINEILKKEISDIIKVNNHSSSKKHRTQEFYLKDFENNHLEITKKSIFPYLNEKNLLGGRKSNLKKTNINQKINFLNDSNECNEDLTAEELHFKMVKIISQSKSKIDSPPFNIFSKIQ